MPCRGMMARGAPQCLAPTVLLRSQIAHGINLHPSLGFGRFDLTLSYRRSMHRSATKRVWAPGTKAHIHTGTENKQQALSLLPPGRLEEVTNAALASIDGIRSSMEHFQGRPGQEVDERPEDPDALEDLQFRLACYRYSRRIEPPPLPLAMDPSFGPAPPRPDPPVPIVMSSTQLRSFQPQRRRVRLAEQAEHRRLRNEAAKVKRQIAEQENTERYSAEMDRYMRRMDRFENDKRMSRTGGRRRSMASLSLAQQLEERRKQFLQILAAAAFLHRSSKVLDGFGPVSQVSLARFTTLVKENRGTGPNAFAKAAAQMVWRTCYARIMREQMASLAVLQEVPASPRSPMSPMSPRSPSSRQPDGPRLPFLQSGEAIEFLGRVKFVEDQLGARMRIRRQRAAARCLLVVLRSWHPFAIQRMMRHIAACVKRLQQFLHRAVLRLKATRIMVKAQMVQIERELVEKELSEDDAKADPSKRRAKVSAQEQEAKVNRCLLPDNWRTQVVHSMLRMRRLQQMERLREWRVDMSTYYWEVSEWRKSGHSLPIPTMPPYPTHVPSQKVLYKLVVDARKLRKLSPSPSDFVALAQMARQQPVDATGSEWHLLVGDVAGSETFGQTQDTFSAKVIEPLLTPKGTLLR